MRGARFVVFVVTAMVLSVPQVGAAEHANEVVEVVKSSTALPCSHVIGTADPSDANRVMVLGKVLLPRRTLGSGGTVDFADGPRHWLKQGLVIRAGTKLALTVPRAWRGRLAIGWGSPAQPTERITVDRCTAGRTEWLAYAGGYWVDELACVPLIVESGGRRTTARIPLGRPCR